MSGNRMSKNRRTEQTAKERIKSITSTVAFNDWLLKNDVC